MNGILHWLWTATLAGSGAILLTFALVPAIRQWLGARAAAATWLFALALLLSPWPARSPVSVLPPSSDLPEIVVRVVVPSSTLARPGTETASSRRAFPWLFAIWAAGAAGLLAVAGLRAASAWRLVRRSREVSSELAPLLDRLGGLARGIRVHESPEVSGPAVCGLFRPVVLLPEGRAARGDAAELRWILLHEIGHVRRGDLLWRWVFQIVKAVHWFNPLVWLAERAHRVDQEMACDEWVLVRAKSGDCSGYGEALLRAASPSAGARFARAEMAESNRGLARRIRHLTAAHPRGAWAFAVMLALGIAALLLFSPKPPEKGPPPAGKTQMEKTAFRPDGSLPAENSGVEFTARFVEVSPEMAEELFRTGKSILQPDEFQNFLRDVDKRGNLDLMTAPKVVTVPGKKAIIEIVREFVYPTKFEVSKENAVPVPLEFQTKNLGVALEALATLTKDNRIFCTLKPEVTEFLSFINYGGILKPADGGDAIDAAMQPVKDAAEVINQPIFRTREIESTVLLRSGQTVVLGGLLRRDARSLEQTVGAGGLPDAAPPKVEMLDRVLYVFVTVDLIDLQKEFYLPAPPVPQSSPSPVPPPASLPSELPHGTPVSGKPGFITSPYAPERGWVDVRGFPPGTEVRCPYTNKLFVVP